MTDIFRFRGVNGIFADVFRVVAHALEIARNKEQMQVVRNSVWLPGHVRGEIICDIAIHFVDLAVALSERAGEADISIGISADAIAK